MQNRSSVTEGCHLKLQAPQPLKATSSQSHILIRNTQSQTHQVHAGIRGEEDASMLWPQKCNLSCTVAGHVDHFETAGDWQCYAILDLVVDVCWFDVI